MKPLRETEERRSCRDGSRQLTGGVGTEETLEENKVYEPRGPVGPERSWTLVRRAQLRSAVAGGSA